MIWIKGTAGVTPWFMKSGCLAQNTWMLGSGNHLKTRWVPCLVPHQGGLGDRLLSTAPTHGLSAWHSFPTAWRPFTRWLWALGLSVLVNEKKAVSSFLLSLGNHSVTFTVQIQEEESSPHLLMGGMWHQEMGNTVVANLLETQYIIFLPTEGNSFYLEIIPYRSLRLTAAWSYTAWIQITYLTSHLLLNI